MHPQLLMVAESETLTSDGDRVAPLAWAIDSVACSHIFVMTASINFKVDYKGILSVPPISIGDPINIYIRHKIIPALIFWGMLLFTWHTGRRDGSRIDWVPFRMVASFQRGQDLNPHRPSSARPPEMSTNGARDDSDGRTTRIRHCPKR